MKYDGHLVYKAYEFAEMKHRDQFDKAGNSYIEHCCAVANYGKVKLINEDVCFLTIIGLLHDLLEDTNTTLFELAENFGQPVAESVWMLTKRENESYMDYINRIKYNPVTREIKKRDLLHNLRLDRLNKITHEDIKRCEKYLKALGRLIEMEE